MLNIGTDHDITSDKCYFTQCALPQYIDRNQPPTKRKPFSTILGNHFNHTLDLLVPKSAFQVLQDELSSDLYRLQYAKVHLKLKDIIDGDFFNQYIKTGNILMLSEGTPGVDNTYSLCEGILRLELDKPTYERAGLSGRPIPSPGRKHNKSRFAIELNLRLPSMVKGRPLFNRLVYAFENALKDTVTWLFYDLDNPELGSHKDSPLMAHAPFLRTVQPDLNELNGINVPCLPSQISDKHTIDATELLEWLHLAFLASPRLRNGDNIDSSLCQYQIPNLAQDLLTSGDPTTIHPSSPKANLVPCHVDDLVRLRWRGLLPAKYISRLFMALLKKLPQEQWLSIRVESFDGSVYTIMKRGESAMLWECE